VAVDARAGHWRNWFGVTEEAEKNRAGELIGGRYRLDHLLGKGGQGHVFAATDLQDGEQVAVKTLSGPKAGDPEWRERMFREARAMVSLVGTSAVRVLDQKWSERGELCLILERLHGRDFEDYLIERETSGRRTGLSELVDLLTPVARTLETAHAAGILHRDIKPSNIFITKDGGVRLLDFGFAKFVSLRGLTRAGHVAGSPSYIAPEAWGGKPDVLDARVDVYGLAAVVFRALAGHPPFQSAKVYDLFKMVTEAPRPSLRQFRPDLPEDIDAWVELSLAIDPDQRFSQIHALWTAISSISARSRPPPGKPPPPRKVLDMEQLELAFAPTDPPDPDDVPTPIDLPSVDVHSLEDSSPAARGSLLDLPSGDVVALEDSSSAARGSLLDLPSGDVVALEDSSPAARDALLKSQRMSLASPATSGLIAKPKRKGPPPAGAEPEAPPESEAPAESEIVTKAGESADAEAPSKEQPAEEALKREDPPESAEPPESERR
jgi:serine/threonine-protein kinase